MPEEINNLKNLEYLNGEDLDEKARKESREKSRKWGVVTVILVFTSIVILINVFLYFIVKKCYSDRSKGVKYCIFISCNIIIIPVFSIVGAIICVGIYMGSSD